MQMKTLFLFMVSSHFFIFIEKNFVSLGFTPADSLLQTYAFYKLNLQKHFCFRQNSPSCVKEIYE